jgi:hypothetical protein
MVCLFVFVTGVCSLIVVDYHGVRKLQFTSSDSALDSTCNGNGNIDHHQSALASIDERRNSSFAATKHTEHKLGSPSTSLGTAARRYSRRVSPITAAIRQKLIRQCEKTNENIQQLTINKLQYASVGMVGRERETKLLQSCLKRLNQQQKTNKYYRNSI